MGSRRTTGMAPSGLEASLERLQRGVGPGLLPSVLPGR